MSDRLSVPFSAIHVFPSSLQRSVPDWEHSHWLGFLSQLLIPDKLPDTNHGKEESFPLSYGFKHFG